MVYVQNLELTNVTVVEIQKNYLDKYLIGSIPWKESGHGSL